MTLESIFRKYQGEINDLTKSVVFNKLRKGFGNRTNLLFTCLISDLINFYEENKFNKTICFKINKESIIIEENESYQDYEKNFWAADLGLIIIGNFHLETNIFIKDDSLKVWAQTSGSVFYSNINPFEIIHNSMTNGLKKIA